MNMKKVLSTVVLGAFSLSLVACGGGGQKAQPAQQQAEEKVYKIGIAQLVTHGALDESNRGIVDGLAAEGFVDGKNIVINQQNAQGEQANLQTIAQQFLSEEEDLIFAIATPTAQVMAAATDTTPIVGTAITSFSNAKLVESDAHPGTNVTGTHDMTPIAEQMDLLLQILPDAKVVGTVYTSSEVNSQVQVDLMKTAAAERGLEVVETTISTVNDIQQATQSIVGKVDAIWLPTDNNIASAMPQLVGVCEDANKLVVCGEESMVKAGGCITYGINFYSIGYDAGLMAAQILRGEAVPADMPIGDPKAEDLKLVANKAALERIGVQLPAELAERVAYVDAE